MLFKDRYRPRQRFYTAVKVSVAALCLISLFPSSTEAFARPKINVTGFASYYSRRFHGKCCTASGEKVNVYALTAAHRTLPFGSRVRVTNLRNSKSVIVRINDRGPYGAKRIIDLSYAAFQKIGKIKKGMIKIRLEVL